MTLADAVGYATIISGLGGAASAFFAAKALLEVKRQREAMYKPDLVINSGQFYIYNKYTDKGVFPDAFPAEYSYEKRENEYAATGYRLVPLMLRLHNIGIGAAKNVEVVFEISINDWKEIINAYNKHITGTLPFIIEYKSDLDVVLFKSAHYVDYGSRHLPVSQGNKIIVNHILPVSLHHEPYLVPVPLYLLFFISSCIYLGFHTQNMFIDGKVAVVKDFPSFKIHLTYLDIANEFHLKSFKGKISVGSRSVAKSSYSTGYFELEQIA